MVVAAAAAAAAAVVVAAVYLITVPYNRTTYHGKSYSKLQ